MDRRFDRIEQKLDRLDVRLDTNTQVLERLTIVVEEHERRSLALEQIVEQNKDRMEAKLDPIQRHVTEVNTTFKITKWVVGMLTASVLAALGKYLLGA